MAQDTICVGHRGAKPAPENTLAGFRLALELGCPWVELDVWLVQGELVVIHDWSLDRTTNGTGKLRDHSFEALRGLDAGQGERIPTLREVVEMVDRRAVINVELKGPGTGAAASALLDDYCRRGWLAEDFLLSSFELDELGAASDGYRRGLLFGEPPRDMWQLADGLRGWSVHVYKKYVTAELVGEAHARGYRLFVFTVNEPSDIDRALVCGVDGVFSDYPDRVLARLV